MKRFVIAGLAFVFCGVLVLGVLAAEGDESADAEKAEECLVGWWSFENVEETAKGLLVKDSSPNKLDGLVQGEAKQVEGKVGKGLEFAEGAKTFVQVKGAEALDFSDAITVMAWIKPGEEQIYTKGMAGILDRGGQIYRLCLVQNKAPYAATFQIRFPGNKFGTVSSERKIEAGRWTFLAGSYESETGKFTLYLDGKKVKETKRTPAEALPKNKTNLIFGRRDNLAFFQGVMDEVKIYSRVLKVEEIKAAWEKAARDEKQEE